MNLTETEEKRNHTEAGNDTKKLQSLIDQAHREGGGKVVIPAGKYLIGSLRLYSDITLYLQAGAELYGSKDYLDYTDYHVPTTMKYVKDPEYKEKWNLPDYYIYGMLCAFGEKNISIIGEKGALIDGQDCFDANGEEKFRGPMGIILSSCENVHLQGYTFRNSANWSHQIDGCRNVRIEEVCVQAGHDGFNFHHCTDVEVRRCELETGDDCIAGYDIENLRVEDCMLNTACNSMRIGGVNLLFERCKFYGPGKYPHRIEGTFYTHAMFKYYAIGIDDIRRDAGDIRFRECEMQNVTRLFSYRHGDRELMQENRPLRSLTLERCTINGLEKTSFFCGNRERCRLILKEVEMGSVVDCPGHIALEIDDAVTLHLEQVRCAVPVRIFAPEGAEIMIKECENIEILRRRG